MRLCATSVRSLSGGAVEEVVDGGKDGLLLAAGQALDALQAFEQLAVGLAFRGHWDRLRGVQQNLNGHVEGGGKAKGDFGGEAEHTDFVIGDHGLNDVDALCEFALAQAAQGGPESEVVLAYGRDHDLNIGAASFVCHLGETKVLMHRAPAFSEPLQQRWLANAIAYLTGVKCSA